MTVCLLTDSEVPSAGQMRYRQFKQTWSKHNMVRVFS